MYDDNALTYHAYFREDMSREKDGMLLAQFPNELPGHRYLNRVNAYRRFIQNQYVGLVDNRLCYSDSLSESF